uniref:Uncharacterized protein n=1 Tax=Corynoplastis japonica TaxID=700918 RepID=A0A1X9PTV4_9RHOD|nr:hypothetical protein [Corynoplastis japonica]
MQYLKRTSLNQERLSDSLPLYNYFLPSDRERAAKFLNNPVFKVGTDFRLRRFGVSLKSPSGLGTYSELLMPDFIAFAPTLRSSFSSSLKANGYTGNRSESSVIHQSFCVMKLIYKIAFHIYKSISILPNPKGSPYLLTMREFDGFLLSSYKRAASPRLVLASKTLAEMKNILKNYLIRRITKKLTSITIIDVNMSSAHLGIYSIIKGRGSEVSKMLDNANFWAQEAFGLDVDTFKSTFKAPVYSILNGASVHKNLNSETPNGAIEEHIFNVFQQQKLKNLVKDNAEYKDLYKIFVESLKNVPCFQEIIYINKDITAHNENDELIVYTVDREKPYILSARQLVMFYKAMKLLC